MSIYGGMNYYVFRSITRGFIITGLNKKMVAAFFIAMASTFIVSQFLRSKIDVYVLFFIGALWLGILSISISILFIKDIAVYFFPHMRRLTTLISLLLILFGTGISIFNVLKGPVVKNVDIRLKDYPTASEALTVVHLSDIHLGMMTSRAWLDSVINTVNQLEADIIVITGDIIDDDYHHVEKFIPQMKGLKSRYGVYAVSGNHEVYRGIDSFHEFTKATNIIAVDSELQVIENKANIMGLEDYYAGRNNRIDFKQKLESLISQGISDNINILLFHQPEYFEEAAGLGIDLQLSGHTHGGQIPPLNFLIPLRYKYGKGLYSYMDSFIYTSTGTGTWGPPMRIFSSSEIVKITIR